MKRMVILVAALLMGGCVGDGRSSPSTSTSSSSPDELHPKRMCESTSIAGEPKTVCY